MAIRDAEYGAGVAQNQAQQAAAASRKERNASPELAVALGVSANLCDSLPIDALTFNGEGGILPMARCKVICINGLRC